MKCLVVTPYFPPALGGACRVLGQVAGALAGDGHDVTVLTFGNDTAAEREHDRAAPFQVHRSIADWQSLRTVAAKGQLMARLVRKSNYDLIFCGTAFPSAVLAYLASRVRRVPYVVYSHGEDVTIVADSKWQTALLKRALRGSKHLFANSGFTRRALVQAGAREVETLHPSINSAAFAAATNAEAMLLLETLGLENRASNLLITVARLQERKGHDVVVRALPLIATMVPDVHYLIIGKGDRSRLSGLAKELGVEDRVTIVESLAESSLAAAYRAAKINVLVSRADAKEVEGFGMVYLEAGAAGRPSVAGNQGGAPEAVVDGVTGVLVDPTSPEETAQAVIALLNDEGRRTEMGVAAKRRSIDEFDDAVFLSRIREVCARNSKGT